MAASNPASLFSWDIHAVRCAGDPRESFFLGAASYLYLPTCLPILLASLELHGNRAKLAQLLVRIDETSASHCGTLEELSKVVIVLPSAHRITLRPPLRNSTTHLSLPQLDS